MALSVLEAFAVMVLSVVDTNCWSRQSQWWCNTCGSMIGVVSFCTSRQGV